MKKLKRNEVFIKLFKIMTNLIAMIIAFLVYSTKVVPQIGFSNPTKNYY